MEEFHLTVAEIHADKAKVTSNAMLNMDDGVVSAQFCQVSYHRMDITRAGTILLLSTRRTSMTWVQVTLGEHDQVIGFRDKASVKWGHHHAKSRAFNQKGLKRFDGTVGRDAMFSQHLRDGFTSSV